MVMSQRAGYIFSLDTTSEEMASFHPFYCFGPTINSVIEARGNCDNFGRTPPEIHQSAFEEIYWSAVDTVDAEPLDLPSISEYPGRIVLLIGPQVGKSQYYHILVLA